MIQLKASVLTDVDQIRDWIQADPWHKGLYEPEYWLTGNDCYVAFCLDDEIGPTMYVRFDREGQMLRLRTQFGPPDEVSKERISNAILEAIPAFIRNLDKEIKGIVFETENRSLASFMKYKLNFEPIGNNDYCLKFEDN